MSQASCQFDMWENNITCEENKSESYFFYVQFLINFVIQFLPHHHQLNIFSSKKSGYIPRNNLTNEAEVRHNMSRILSSAPIPTKDVESIINTISSKAQSLHSDSCNAGRNVIPVVMSLRVFFMQEHNNDVDLEWESTLGTSLQSLFNMRATKEAVTRLDKFVFEKGSCLMEQCPICWQEFLVGEEVTGMPCMHVYHGDCIVQWLKKSCICPSCRFPLPVCQVPETLYPFKTRKHPTTEKRGARMSVRYQPSLLNTIVHD